jgi:hypothetical protein
VLAGGYKISRPESPSSSATLPLTINQERREEESKGDEGRGEMGRAGSA